MASEQVELNHQIQNGTSGTLANQTVADMQLIKSYSWTGSFLSIDNSPPKTIPINGEARFEHLRDEYKGSKAVVIYTIPTAACLPAAVLLGWSAPIHFNPSIISNKVLGVIGTRSVIESMSWDQIQVLFDNAGSSVVVNKDGVCMRATIRHNPATKMADLVANFGYLCPRP